MRNTFPLLAAAALLLSAAAFRTAPPKGWEPLLDPTLSKWQTYLSHRHVPGDKGQPPTDAQGQPLPPIGYDKNEANVFSVALQGGEPVLRISGEIYGCVFTKQDYTNYDLKLKVKWGQKKWLPRLNEPRDSGILYNSQGECGADYWHSWMLSQEFQVSEYQKGNAMGDYWCIANSAADIAARRGQDTLRYDPAAPSVQLGGANNAHFCYAASIEHPKGEWTELELINVNGQSLHLVNGQVVMAVNHSSYLKDGQRQPLTHGKIQLQSEAAEVFYKGITIKPLAAMPAQYAKYFAGK
ncbi:DUF1080 domain-containing protein [Hymenobacter artigasi]|uniref:3-keto-alpha-glucoside-1,2-lyase/3-keto-2-hydroxy-glucal hydratase domain-containing protein n=1 Tax=Hymenobacter artigasi TaxID=2719616 RepID=A0ABX1HKC9_9BACT|nr:DUF1080 domain-containing protein [Hymenobacter artigasi]NKI89456.1 hypothetical protein [Hymenobacter artigasi]